MIDALLNIIAPHRCCSCGAVGSILCESCKINILDEPYTRCIVCQRPCGLRGICTSCSKVLPVEQAWCVGERSGALKSVLDAYKFSASRAAAADLASLLQATLPEIPPGTAVVGVPASPRTRRWRGFDHMGLVVHEFARKRKLETIHPLVRASSVTLHFLPKQERTRLGSSLFRLSGRPVPSTVLLVDDILTTGTTLRAAATLLRQAGAERVYIAVIARQPEHSSAGI